MGGRTGPKTLNFKTTVKEKDTMKFDAKYEIHGSGKSSRFLNKMIVANPKGNVYIKEISLSLEWQHNRNSKKNYLRHLHLICNILSTVSPVDLHCVGSYLLLQLPDLIPFRSSFPLP